ncbi:MULTISPECIES: aldehyde dehydrogenase family protein [unclassified Microbacterium]|uniref:aldehyde dehydrogenase family protein n=1 Tax=unclassified Microbacterium TaxID=2609290 RepID=UPI00097F177C|nr:aldehyde dehydrogenase family protein [Microbacterium sp. JB110]RCS63043.1 aldehyde dehydrogenase family protein [Microbacterium sp. JB110]SJM60477.1 Aldehyde dehydrogenase [Frigoribacterium sp. JB110]
MSYGAIEQEEIFAGGEWLTPHAAARIELESPVDFRRTGGAVDGDERDVDTAVRAAREAFDHGPWPRMSPEERAGWLERLADEIERRADATVSLVTTEIGQPVSIARPWAGIRPIAHLRFYAQLLRRPDAVEEVRENAMRPGTTIVQHEPLGVAALIVPWNHPQASTTLKLAPALAAGSTVVVKPAPESPLDISNMAEASTAIGMPPGVINIVTGGRETGRALVQHPGVDKVGFTGSSAAGRDIAAQAGAQLKPATLELGGKSAAILLGDADLDAVMGALRVSSFENTGQTCALMARVLVPRAAHDEVVDRLVALARDLRVGDPSDPATELGPLVSRRIHDRVSGMVSRAAADGATLLAGDSDLPDTGYYVAPTIVTGAVPSSEIAQEEVFGPVVSVFAYDDLDDAVALANNSRYGLAGSVFGDPDEALGVARRVRTGSIGINGYKPDLNTPYGGYGDSGLGREFAIEGLRNFQEVKSIWR